MGLVSTLANWIGKVAERVEPLVQRIGQRMLETAYVVATPEPQSPAPQPLHADAEPHHGNVGRLRYRFGRTRSSPKTA